MQWPKEKGQTTIYKSIHRKQKIKQHESHKQRGVNSGAIFCAFQNCFMNFIIILHLPRTEFVTYHRVSNKSSTMGDTCGLRTA
jgi:hypothetical protein